MKKLLKLGKTVITPEALEKLHRGDVFTALFRHASGDWGELELEDRNANAVAVCKDARVVSVYRDRNRTEFWIITEADRSATTVLLPNCY